MTDKKATGQFITRLDPKLHHELRMHAATHGVSMREIVENCVANFLRSRAEVPSNSREA
jgi:predicted HicB family RNase H-like nuclease